MSDCCATRPLSPADLIADFNSRITWQRSRFGLDDLKMSSLYEHSTRAGRFATSGLFVGRADGFGHRGKTVPFEQLG